MIKYRVIVTDKAKQDISEIYDYITDQLCAEQTAKKLYKCITDAILSLSYFPHRIKVISNEFDFGDVRKLLVYNYCILFVIKGYSVIVFNVLHGSSNIEEKLKEN